MSSEGEDADVIVIGSGIAGLSCAAILATTGKKVTVFESHYEIGGCAHDFLYNTQGKSIPSERLSSLTESEKSNLFRFEAGPSLYSGLSQHESPNPLKHVFQMIDEDCEWITYDKWGAYLPEAPDGYKLSIGAEAFEVVLDTYGGPTAKEDWRKLAAALRPIAEGVMGLPTVAVRPDMGSLVTLGLRYPLSLLKTIIQGQALTRPFNLYYEELNIQDNFLKNYLNLLCFLLQGMPAEGTLSAVMAYMMDDFYKPNAVMDFPKGGSGAIIAALERGVLKNGGKVVRRATVEEILIDDDKAVGVRVKKDGSDGAYDVRADTVVTNTDLWSTMKLIPAGKSNAFDEERVRLNEAVPLCKSFVHIHIGIEGKHLPKNIPAQWTIANTWDEPIDSPGNVIVVSMPSLLDPSLAPEGKHVIHAYTAGNEPYDLYAKFKNGNNKKEYEQFKEERAACLWKAIEKEIPDVKNRTIVSLIGTPLTHERFNRRYKGTYGPALSAGNPFPGQTTPIKNLFRCGDSTNPGIGVPAVAASGAMAANAIIELNDHWKLLNKIRM